MSSANRTDCNKPSLTSTEAPNSNPSSILRWATSPSNRSISPLYNWCKSISDFIRHGKDLERIVLARAVWWHVERKILVYGPKQPGVAWGDHNPRGESGRAREATYPGGNVRLSVHVPER